MTYRVRNIGLALVLGVLAALLTGFYVTNYKRTVQRSEAAVTVLVAAEDIPAGTTGADVLENHLLSPREVTRRTVVPGAITSGEEIEELVATQSIFAGEQVTTRRFRPVAQRGIRSELKGNLRAFQVAGDPNQLLVGTLKAGDHVDLMASIKYKVSDVVGGGDGTSGEVERVATRVVLRDIPVLRVANLGANAKITSGNGSDAVVLQVSDAQAQKLFFVLRNGEWSLQLRPVLNAADSPDSVETIESVLGDGLKPRQYRQLYTGKELPR
jgi:pilus assembly protein CpaB